MTLTAAPIGDNPQVTRITSFTYLPDQLIVGNLKLVTSPAAVSGAGGGIGRRRPAARHRARAEDDPKHGGDAGCHQYWQRHGCHATPPITEQF